MRRGRNRRGHTLRRNLRRSLRWDLGRNLRRTGRSHTLRRDLRRAGCGPCGRACGGLSKTAGKVTQNTSGRLHRGQCLRVLPEAAVCPAGHKKQFVIVHSLPGTAPDGVHQGPLRHGLFFQ